MSAYAYFFAFTSAVLLVFLCVSAVTSGRRIVSMQALEVDRNNYWSALAKLRVEVYNERNDAYGEKKELQDRLIRVEVDRDAYRRSTEQYQEICRKLRMENNGQVHRIVDLESRLSEQAGAPQIEDLTFTVSLAPDIWGMPEPRIRHEVERMILAGLTEQIKPHIEFTGPIYTPFQLPQVQGRLSVVKGDKQHDRQEA